MQALLRASRLIDSLTGGVGRLVSWLTLAMVLLGSFNALARWWDSKYSTGDNLSSNAYLEGQWYLFSLVFLLGAAGTLREDKHVRVDVIYSRLSTRAKAWVDLLGSLMFLLPFCLVALWLSWPSVSDSIARGERSPDPEGLPRYPIKAMIMVAFFLLALQGASEVIKRLGILLGRDDTTHGDDTESDTDEATS